jgi:hypothetical protein
MLTSNRIDRLVATGDFDRLLAHVLGNGRATPLAVRLRLSEASTLPAAALGLALQRLVELTFVPGEETELLVASLLDRQADDGSFGSTAATAVAVAGLQSFLDQLRPMRWYLDSRRPRLESLIRRVETAIPAALITLDSVAEEGDAEDVMIVAWQFGAMASLHQWPGFARVAVAVERHALRHDRSASRLLAATDRSRPKSRRGKSMIAA